MDPRLKQAAESGNTETLYMLIQENPNVLQEFDKVSFIDTPLHIAVAAGQLPFAMEMMNLMPTSAKKLNPSGFSPMHLAVLHEQPQLAFELLKIDSDLTRVKGRLGMTPMHSAVKEGKTDLVAEFLLACPECVSDSNAHGENALHLALHHERIGVLKVITGWIRRMAQKDARFLEILVLNKRDYHGNTVLHLAAYNNKLHAINLLLEC